jgi:hypothetical protein
VQGANHTYWGHEDELSSAIAAFVRTQEHDSGRSHA